MVDRTIRSSNRRWCGVALALVCGALGWTLLSRFFVFGEGHAERPILLFLVSYLFVWIAFAAAAYGLARGGQPSIRLVLSAAVLARLVLIPSGLIQENDVYRYVLDGQVLLHGGNPYEYSPLDLAASGILEEPFEDSDAFVVLERVGYPHIPTVYPPAAQLFFALGARLGGWDWMGQRLVFLTVDLAVILLLLVLLECLSLPRNRVLLYAWNPLVLKEIANSVHLDVVVAFFLILLALCLIRFTERQHWFWAAFGGLCFALAVLSKLYPLIFGPASLRVLLRARRPGPAVLLFAGVAALTLTAAVLPFVGIGWDGLTAGLRTYAEQWRMNQGLFAVVELLTPFPRPAVAAIVALAALVIPWLGSSEDRGRVSRDFFWVLLVWFLLIPTPFPWYALPILGLTTVLPVAVWAVSVVMSGALGLYYLSFYFEYHGHPAVWWAWTRGVEHALIWGALFWCLRRSVFSRRWVETR